MTKRHLLFSLFWSYLLLPMVRGQQLPLFAQYPEYHGLINQASINTNFFTDNGRNISVGVSHRNQWSGLITTNVLRGEWLANFGKYGNFIVGGYVQQDKLGITENTSGHIRIGYLLPLGKDILQSGISLGFNFGGNQRQLRIDQLVENAQRDPDVVSRDPSVSRRDLGFGLFAYRKMGGQESQYLYGGLSIPRIGSGDKDNTIGKRYAHYYGLLGYYWVLDNDCHIEFSTWARKVDSLPFNWSFNVRYQFIKQMWFGGGLVMHPNTNYMFEIGYIHPFGNHLCKLGFAYTLFPKNELSNAYELNLAVVLDGRKK